MNFTFSTKVITTWLKKPATEPQRLRFIEEYDFPAGLKSRFAVSHPALSTENQKLVFVALRDYFVICLRSNRMMAAMPSQIVDDAWHEFILFTRDYNEFCD